MTLRKTVIADAGPASAREDAGRSWLDVERLARVEVTSEDPERPVDAALLPGRRGGWRAGHAGRQTIRLLFDHPTRVQHIALSFEERDAERTQEIALRWRAEAGEPREIVRQRWNFSPSGSVQEDEDYRVDLAGVTMIELEIVPDVSGGPARATLARWRLA